MEYYSAIKKQQIYEILKEMDATIKYYSEWGNPITKEDSWYALTGKRILAQKPGMTKIQFINQMTLKKKKEQSIDI